jgi:hypothetical protein
VEELKTIIRKSVSKDIINQKFFFRRHKPKWHSVPAEELFKLGHLNDTKENNNL